MRAEMKSAKWLWGGIGLQFAVGYTVSYLVYTLGSLIVGDQIGVGAALAGLAVIAVIVAFILYLIAGTNKKLKEASALKGAK
jgi:ferrous iron transport protein B